MPGTVSPVSDIFSLVIPLTIKCVTTSDKRRFPDLPDVSRDRGDVPRALVLLSVLGRQRELSASTRSRSFRTGSGIRRIGGAAYQSPARRRTSGRVGPR